VLSPQQAQEFLERASIAVGRYLFHCPFLQQRIIGVKILADACTAVRLDQS
jgi:hypothetical protein